MIRPLFTRFPGLKNCLAHQNLAALPTPIEKLSIADNAWIKRDDLTHTEYGGNKIRKLEFIIADARKRGAKRIVTFGAIGTNHGVATAMLCNRFGLACTVYLFDQPVTETVQQNLRLMQYYEADLVYKGSLLSTVLAYYLNPMRASKSNYFLFAGGSNVPGTLSFVNAAFELKQQIAQGCMPEPGAIICPVGSSATLAGLTLGCQMAGIKTKVIGVRVAPSHLGPFPACTVDTVSSLIAKTHRYMATQLGIDIPAPLPPVLLDEYYGEGYGVASDEGWEAQALMQANGIKVEQTYTAKAVAAFLDELKKRDTPVLYWHTFNSNDMSKQAASVSITDLPKNLQSFIESPLPDNTQVAD